MKRTFLHFVSSLSLLFVVQVSLAQAQPNEEIKNLQEKLQKVEAANSKLNTEIKNLKTDFSDKLTTATDSIEKLKSRLQANEQLIQSINEQLENKISTTENNSNQKIDALHKTVNSDKFYWIIAVILIALLSVLLFFWLRKQLAKDETDLTENIEQTKKALQEEIIKLDSKLTESLKTQIQLIKAELQAMQKK